MKKMVGFIGLAFLPLMVACSLTARPSQWQPTAVTDFKSVGGKWEGQLIRDNSFHAKLRLGDYRHWRYGDMRIRSSENQDNRSRWFSEQQCGPCVKREWKVSFDRRQTQHDRLEGRPNDTAALCGSGK